MPIITLSPTQPFQVVGQDVDAEPLAVQNTGTTTVYLSHDPGVSSTTYDYTIGPGGDFLWPANKPLYMVASSTGGQVSYGPQGAQVNTGATISNAANAVVPIYSVDIPVPAGTGSGPSSPNNVSNIINVSAYASIFVTIAAVFTTPTPPPSNNYVELDMSQASSPDQLNASFLNGHIDFAQWLLTPSNSQTQTWQVPVINQYMQLFYGYSKGTATSTGFTLQIRVYGTNQIITTPQYNQGGTSHVGNIIHVYGGQVSGVSNTTNALVTKQGPVTVVLANVGTGTGDAALSLSYIFNGNSIALWNGFYPAPGAASLVVQLVLPPLPIYVSIVTNGAGDILRYSIVQP